ncbi:MAG: sugar phosphorylase [Anaerolineaceae bacterium]|nr:sugar phosphorylase [Anaerolineaceae bacterium]
MNPIEKQILADLSFLYGEAQAEAIFEQLLSKITAFTTEHPAPDFLGAEQRVTKEDVILITYGDMLQRAEQPPLRVMKEFVHSTLRETINTVHILPFFPYSSDDGFSVIDYKQVNPAWGNWTDIDQLSEDVSLMFDVVVNHISQHSEWFKAFLRCEPEYKDYFIAVDPATDLSEVFRPRALPLLHAFETAEGEKWVWTTFSQDQIDLNFSNPEVLLEVLDVFLFYIGHGARCIRLDAVAFIWKEIGTSCLHLPQTHRVIQLTRRILDLVAPHVVLITETNVPHDENISYFGDGQNEAQMVYNFSLPPLVLHSITTGNAAKLLQWASTLDLPSEEVTFFNFLASHDGIGLLPARGILTEAELNQLAEHVLEMGGRVSYKNNSDGSKSPYELNINYLDASRKADTDEDVEWIAKRFLASQSVMLELRGVPGIYYHSLFGSQNWIEGLLQTGQNRTINREKLNLDRLIEELDSPQTLRHHVFQGFQRMLRVRTRHDAFDPHGMQKIINHNKHVFAVFRQDRAASARLFCLSNLSDQPQQIQITLADFIDRPVSHLTDLIAGTDHLVSDGSFSLILEPYQIAWLEPCEME